MVKKIALEEHFLCPGLEGYWTATVADVDPTFLKQVVARLSDFGELRLKSMDSAGIGELALLQSWAQGKNVSLKCAGPNPLVRTLLDLTNLDSVLEVHPTVDAALASFREDQVCADC